MPKHLLFDFGQVLIPIDTELSYAAFEKLGAKEDLADQNETFAKMERGDLSKDEFLGALQPFFFRKNIFKNDLAEAWNALCYAPIPAEHFDLLKKLKRKGHKLFLLSNTNALHIAKIKELCGPFNYKQFLKLFDGIYYSHEMGTRKPEVEFYQKVLETESISAEDCFFVDDREENIQAAEALGMETWLLDPEEDSVMDIKGKL